jgi:hypothetical protein
LDVVRVAAGWGDRPAAAVADGAADGPPGDGDAPVAELAAVTRSDAAAIGASRGRSAVRPPSPVAQPAASKDVTRMSAIPPLYTAVIIATSHTSVGSALIFSA